LSYIQYFEIEVLRIIGAGSADVDFSAVVDSVYCSDVIAAAHVL